MQIIIFTFFYIFIFNLFTDTVEVATNERSGRIEAILELISDFTSDISEKLLLFFSVCIKDGFSTVFDKMLIVQ